MLTQFIIPWINEAYKLSVIAIIVAIIVLGVMHNIFTDNHESNTCSCIGDTLTFECTIMNGLGTAWRGSAFNCASSGNEINLLVNNIGDLTCNDGLIIGRVIKREGNNYTSQLNVTLSSNLIGQIIECTSDNGSQRTPIFNITLDIRKWACSYNIIIVSLITLYGYTLLNAVPFPPPEAISLALVNFGPKEITFSWSPVAPDCPSIHYNILASNCGSCPTITNHTNVTCTDVPTDGMCTLAVETVVCGNITGNRSKPLTFKTTSTLFTELNSRCTCTGTTATASVFATGLTISVIVFTSIIIVLLKANKKARRSDLATRRREQERSSSHKEPRRTTAPDSTINTTIMDHERAKVAVIATNRNIAYADVAVGQTQSKN